LKVFFEFKFKLTFALSSKFLSKKILDIEQLQSKVNELLHENKLIQTQYDERKIHIQYVLNSPLPILIFLIQIS
jgi:hypothetical protein